MLKALVASTRDVILAGFAAFVGAVALADGQYSKAVFVAAAYAALRAAVGVVAVKLDRLGEQAAED
jgi:hypothetical protein